MSRLHFKHNASQLSSSAGWMPPALFSPARRLFSPPAPRVTWNRENISPLRGSDSSVAAGRIRQINRKKSVTPKASVCVWYWLGHAPVDLYLHVLRYSSWGSLRGLCKTALISFAFVEQRGGKKNPFKNHPLKCVAKRYLSSVITGLVHSSLAQPSQKHFWRPKIMWQRTTSTCFYCSIAVKAQRCLNWIPAAEKMMDVWSHFFPVWLLLSPCMEKRSGTSFPHPVKWNIMLFIQKWNG